MNKREQIFKCSICGNVIEFVHASAGAITCCGKEMELMEEKTADFKTEKHVPVLSENIEGIKIRVGSTLHPMTKDHYIEWIEVINGDYINRKHLSPSDTPEAFFYVHKQDGLIIRSYCNIHGLWKA